MSIAVPQGSLLYRTVALMPLRALVVWAVCQLAGGAGDAADGWAGAGLDASRNPATPPAAAITTAAAAATACQRRFRRRRAAVRLSTDSTKSSGGTASAGI